jgi:hypothetical protein
MTGTNSARISKSAALLRYASRARASGVSERISRFASFVSFAEGLKLTVRNLAHDGSAGFTAHRRRLVVCEAELDEAVTAYHPPLCDDCEEKEVIYFEQTEAIRAQVLRDGEEDPYAIPEEDEDGEPVTDELELDDEGDESEEQEFADGDDLLDRSDADEAAEEEGASDARRLTGRAPDDPGRLRPTPPPRRSRTTLRQPLDRSSRLCSKYELSQRASISPVVDTY